MFTDTEYEFEKQLRLKQFELEMNNSEFAKYIGMHRTWFVNLYNKNIPKHPLSKQTMAKLYNRLGIDFDVMLAYNNQILKGRLEHGW